MMTMERRKALALAAAVTGSLGSATVAVAAVGGLSVLGFGAGHHATQLSSLASYQTSGAGAGGVVTRTKDVYDRVTVGTHTAAMTRSASAAAPAVLDPTVAPGPTDAVPALQPAKTHRRRTTKAVPRSTTRTPTPTTIRSPAVQQPEPPEPATTTTTEPPAIQSPTTTTTMAPVTTTTRPRGVPADWPPGKPIPPMPPNCRDPQLEDNGVWNCDH